MLRILSILLLTTIALAHAGTARAQSCCFQEDAQGSNATGNGFIGTANPFVDRDRYNRS